MTERPTDAAEPLIIISYSEDEVDAILERRLRFAADAYGKATAYDTAITVAGYGAFFALWAGVAADVTPAARSTSAALMGVSLVLYIAWHLLTMMARHRFDREMVAATRKAQPAIDVINEWDQWETRKTKGLLWLQARFWRPIFGTAVLTGALGAGTLVYSSLAVVLDLPQLVGF